jgi:cysteine-rich repeat protein
MGPRISADGRFVGFASWASDLVPNDTNGTNDVFVHDYETGETMRASVASNGSEADNPFPGQGSTHSNMSGDGRFVAFASYATNLVPDDPNGFVRDVFVHDRLTGDTTLVSVSSDGIQGDNFNGLFGVLDISPDGRFVTFSSLSANLVPGDTNGVGDLFMHDRFTGETTRVSVTSSGLEGNDDSGHNRHTMSADGRFVVFDSEADNLVPDIRLGDLNVFLHDRTCGNGMREASEACDDGNLVDGDGCEATCVPTGCGDGIRDPGEECDDGNLIDADGCEPDCSRTVCPKEPAPECRGSIRAGRTLLVVKNTARDGSDRLAWKWASGEATSMADFGDPVGGATDYALCVYERSGGPPRRFMSVGVPGGGTCRGRPCWKATSSGFRYKDPDRASDGVTLVFLREGEDGNARIKLRAVGVDLDPPALGFMHSTIVAQLQNSDGECWEASYSGPFQRNTTKQFRDRGD